MDPIIYRSLVFAHLLLFVLWLGADAGVFLLGQHFRKRALYSLEQRMTLLKMLVLVDMIPRSAWALMVPVSLTLSWAGAWWPVPGALIVAAWGVGAAWLWLVWDAHAHGLSDRARRDRAVEAWLRYGLATFYLSLGFSSLVGGWPIAVPWLAAKALGFGLIFIAAILIDVMFKPVGGQLARLLDQGSSDATELPLRRTMDRTRIFVFAVYALLVVTAWLGVVKPG